MRFPLRSMAWIAFAALSCLRPAPSLAQPPGTPLPNGIRGGSELVPEQGVTIRSYRFAETGEELPYSVFVSSKVEHGKKAPLIIALRGYTGTTLTFVRGTTVDLAEQGGYILVGPIGYNNRAGFGVPPRPRTTAPNANVPAPPPQPAPPIVGGTAETDPLLATEYSEKDVMNVLARVRSELDVDDRRIYLMGHSQGGSGARHLAEKYADIWAAVALLAPAPFGDEPNADSKILHVPILITVGDKDSLLPSAKMFAEQLKALNAQVEYREFAGLDHGTIILGSQPEIFAFFAKHMKTSSTR